jgi:hypothetical protein
MQGDLGANIARWTARFIGVFQILWFMFLFIADYSSSSGLPSTVIDMATMVIAFGIIAGMVIAWFRERSGAVIVLVSAALFAAVGYLRAGNPGLLLMALFPALVGGLHLLSSQLRDPSIAK